MLYDACATEFNDAVDIPATTVLRYRAGPPSVEDVVQLVNRNSGSFLLVFVHHDQDSSRARLEREWLTPLLSAWGSRIERLVTVVPIRETEAWVLADGNALRRALGVRWGDDELGVPGRPREVERIDDPKVPLSKVAGRIGRPVAFYFERLAELISLDVLRDVPSFASVRATVVETLTELGYSRRARS
jgi:hypothetical protein